jgi:hypothetical protein
MSKKSKKSGKAKLPVVTVAYYGPDDETATKVAVGIVREWGKGPAELKRWWGQDVMSDRGIQQQVADFIATHRAKSVVVTEGIIGCPHEEGIDYPAGQECPYCPFWRGKQSDVKGSVFSMERHGGLTPKLDKSAVVMAVATYTREQWEKLMEVADDRDKLESSWEEWRAGKEEALAHIREQGFEPIEIPVDVDALQEFCRKRGLRNDSGARAEYAAYQAQRRRQSADSSHSSSAEN